MSVEDDHIPLKDEFSGDQSDIEIGDKHEDGEKAYEVAAHKNKKIKKKNRGFIWKNKWVKIQNSVTNSDPILIRRWVRIKLDEPIEQIESEYKNGEKYHELGDAENGESGSEQND